MNFGFLHVDLKSNISMINFIRRIRQRFCKHKWVQGAEYWHNKTGENYDYLLPEPMLHHPDMQANCYVCEKCGLSITTIEKIENNKVVGVF